MFANKKSPYIYRFGERIQIGNSDYIFAKIESHILSNKGENIFLDLENVKECCSYGIKLLLNIQRLAESNNCRLFLYKPSQILQELLDLTKLTKVFEIVHTFDISETDKKS